jgi:hypothetical protein
MIASQVALGKVILGQVRLGYGKEHCSVYNMNSNTLVIQHFVLRQNNVVPRGPYHQDQFYKSVLAELSEKIADSLYRQSLDPKTFYLKSLFKIVR